MGPPSTGQVVLLVWLVLSVPVSLVAGRLLERNNARYPLVQLPRQWRATQAQAARAARASGRRVLAVGATCVVVVSSAMGSAAALGSLPGPAQSATATVIEALSPFTLPREGDRAAPATAAAPTRATEPRDVGTRPPADPTFPPAVVLLPSPTASVAPAPRPVREEPQPAPEPSTTPEATPTPSDPPASPSPEPDPTDPPTPASPSPSDPPPTTPPPPTEPPSTTPPSTAPPTVPPDPAGEPTTDPTGGPTVGPSDGPVAEPSDGR